MNKKQYTEPRMVKAHTIRTTLLLSSGGNTTTILEAGSRSDNNPALTDGAETVSGGQHEMYPDFN